tara:strand:- start:162 stop:581 length:420 start_codon:yes stop_codon:yes gene_type:complete
MSTKKDLNEIAAIEKIFSEEYGKQSVKNFKSGWNQDKEKKYLRQLKLHNKKINSTETATVIVDGIRFPQDVIEKKEERTCPVCKTYSFSGKDDLYMNRFKCCYECYIDFVQGREDRWSEGYIPSSERIQASLNRRKKNG